MLTIFYLLKLKQMKYQVYIQFFILFFFSLKVFFKVIYFFANYLWILVITNNYLVEVIQSFY